MANFLRKFVISKSRSKSPTKRQFLYSQPPPPKHNQFADRYRGGDTEWTLDGDERFNGYCEEFSPRRARPKTSKSHQHPSKDTQLNNINYSNGRPSSSFNRPPIHYFTPDYKEIMPDNYEDNYNANNPTDKMVYFYR